MEKWLAREVETPAEEALDKATSGARLTASDWMRLIRFLAAQDVRTPARLAENLQRWRGALPGVVKNTLEESVRRFELAKQSGLAVAPRKQCDVELVPFRVTTEIEPGQGHGRLKGEIVVGRGLWLFWHSTCTHANLESSAAAPVVDS